MFTIDANITDLKAKERNLIRVLFSMNIHQVANPEMSPEEARSYVFFFREGGKVQAYVGLYFINTDRRMYYTHSDNPFPEEAMADVEGEARGFAEDLGAMLDEIDFAKLSSAEKNRWIDDQEFLSGRKQETQSRAEDVAAGQTASVEKPAPVQPAPVQQAAAQPAPIVQQQASAPEAQPQPQPVPAVPPAAPVQPGPVRPPASQQPPPQPVQKAAAPSKAPAQPVPYVPETDQPAPVQRVDEVLEEAVKAGVVKAPKAQLKKDIRSSTGVISREKEALARLLASF
jgi:hypothetical protein